VVVLALFVVLVPNVHYVYAEDTAPPSDVLITPNTGVDNPDGNGDTTRVGENGAGIWHGYDGTLNRDEQSSSLNPENVQKQKEVREMLSAQDAEAEAELREMKIQEDKCEVKAHEISSVQLMTQTAEIPLTIENTCSHVMKVLVYMQSEEFNRLEAQSPVEAELAPNSTNVVNVSVDAKSNGDIDVEVVVLQGETVWNNWKLTVHSYRDVGNTVTIVFIILVAILLLGGIWRTVRRVQGKGKPVESSVEIPTVGLDYSKAFNASANVNADNAIEEIDKLVENERTKDEGEEAPESGGK
jgi:hypothetical protein